MLIRVNRTSIDMTRKQQLKVSQKAVNRILKSFSWIPSYENAVPHTSDIIAAPVERAIWKLRYPELVVTGLCL